MKGIRELAGTVALAATVCFISGCGAVRSGDVGADRCESMRAFTRAPVDASGLRRAWFLPAGVYEDGSIDFYAPMASEPSDRASTAFYSKGVGQLTHYLGDPEFAAALASCLTRRHGYERVCLSQDEDSFRASFVETKTGRSIEIWALDRTTGLMIAEKTWRGDPHEALVYRSSIEKTPDKSMLPTCAVAPGK